MLTIAVAKGRIFESTLQLLDKTGLGSREDMLSSRRLILDDKVHDIRYLLSKPVDVPTYVQQGAADVGIVGKDVLYEAQADVHELLDLQFGRCKIAVAGPIDMELSKVTRVATKYPRYAREYFRTLGRQIDIIPMHGSVELAPLIGLADCIVDIIETGRTLKENGLVVMAELAQITTRLVANRRSYQLRGSDIDALLIRTRKYLEGETVS